MPKSLIIFSFFTVILSFLIISNINSEKSFVNIDGDKYEVVYTDLDSNYMLSNSMIKSASYPTANKELTKHYMVLKLYNL